VADNGQLYISHGDGWTHIGETDGPIEFDRQPGLEQKLFPDLQWPLTVTITVDATGANEALAQLYRMVHDVDRARRPRRHGHCRTCHPEQDRRPLAVDGHGYHRRQRARQRRRHHGR